MNSYLDMLNTKADRICRFCKDIFCCMKCRGCHESKVHPDLNPKCCLCASKILPMLQFNFEKLELEDKELLCHIVNKHLPLHCRLCGELFEDEEDLKSFGACKWWSHRRYLTSPCFEHLERKQYFMSDSDYNGSRFHTPPEIYRKTSTPMFVGQKVDLEYQTPNAPNFSLKTPKTNSPSIAQSNAMSKTHVSQDTDTCDTVFLSFSPHNSHTHERTTPFRINMDEQFLKSNSGRKLDIMEEEDRLADNKAEKMVMDECQVSTVDIDLTCSEGRILQNSSVKKVRFSDQYDQYETPANFQSPIESCAKTILNISAEEMFHDAYDMSNMQNSKDTENTKNTKDTMDTKIAENMEIVKDTKNEAESKTKDTRDNVEDKMCSLIKPLENLLTDSQIRILLNNSENARKENRSPKSNNSNLSTMNQQDSSCSSRVLMMLLVENNSGGLSTDIIPLIDSGLQKLQEQLVSTNCKSSTTSESSSTANLNRSITKMETRSASILETYPVNNINPGTTMTNYRQIVSSSPMQNGISSNNGGFLSTITQIMKHAFKSFSNISIPARSIETTEVIQREIVEKFTTLPGLFINASLSSNNHVRSSKRTRDSEVSSEVDSIVLPLDSRSPLAKRQRGWYSKIKARQPISRMRNNRATTSGVSAETQIFSQGALIVGDTILPLPARAHQSP